jgi:hypothetical protein
MGSAIGWIDWNYLDGKYMVPGCNQGRWGHYMISCGRGKRILRRMRRR